MTKGSVSGLSRQVRPPCSSTKEPSLFVVQLQGSAAVSEECQQRLQDAELVIAELQKEAHQRELQHEKDLVVRAFHVVGGPRIDWLHDTDSSRVCNTVVPHVNVHM